MYRNILKYTENIKFLIKKLQNISKCSETFVGKKWEIKIHNNKKTEIYVLIKFKCKPLFFIKFKEFKVIPHNSIKQV